MPEDHSVRNEKLTAVANAATSAVASGVASKPQTIIKSKLMTTFKTAAVMLTLAGSLFLAMPALAGPQAKTYQVTGPVLELTDTTIVVQKGDEKWQIARDKGTKVSGDLKVGAKVTVQYRCIAVDVEVKTEKPGKKTQ